MVQWFLSHLRRLRFRWKRAGGDWLGASRDGVIKIRSRQVESTGVEGSHNSDFRRRTFFIFFREMLSFTSPPIEIWEWYKDLGVIRWVKSLRGRLLEISTPCSFLCWWWVVLEISGEIWKILGEETPSVAYFPLKDQIAHSEIVHLLLKSWKTSIYSVLILSLFKSKTTFQESNYKS